MNFYSRVLSKFATGSGLRVTVKVEIAHEGGVSEQKVEETRGALRELGLNDVLLLRMARHSAPGVTIGDGLGFDPAPRGQR